MLATTVAMVAGYVDAFGYLSYQTYVSFMSGNTTQGGYGLGQGAAAVALPALLAIAAFLTGVFAGTLLAHSRRLAARRLRFTLAAVILAIIILATRSGLSTSGPFIAALAFGMGILNTCLGQMGAEAVSLTFVTGTLNRVGTHAALAAMRVPLPDAQGPGDTHARRALLLAGVWVGFFGGAVLSGLATPRLGVWVLLAPLATLLALALAERSGER